MGVIAVVILIAGVWDSWGCAQHVMLSKGREQGTMTVSRCDGETCWGPYEPVSTGSRARERVDIERSVAVETDETYTVVVKPGSSDVVRTGPAGLLHAWVPSAAPCCSRRWSWPVVCGWCGRRGCWAGWA